MASSQKYFFIYDDGTGTYPVQEIQNIYSKLQQGLTAEGEPATFSLLGSDGKTYNFTNNGVENWNNYTPSQPITPKPSPAPTPYQPAKPINNNNNNNNDVTSTSSNDILYLIAGAVILTFYIKYKIK